MIMAITAKLATIRSIAILVTINVEFSGRKELKFRKQKLIPEETVVVLAYEVLKSIHLNRQIGAKGGIFFQWGEY